MVLDRVYEQQSYLRTVSLASTGEMTEAFKTYGSIPIVRNYRHGH
jgi:hypothetical protein